MTLLELSNKPSDLSGILKPNHTHTQLFLDSY